MSESFQEQSAAVAEEPQQDAAYADADFEDLIEKNLDEVEMNPGSIVMGVVLSVDKDHVQLHVGLKSEALVPIAQFREDYPQGEIELSQGDNVKVVLECVDDGSGSTRVSRDQARRNEAWDEIERAHALDKPIEGRIMGEIKGGLTVSIKSVRAFLPGSLIDVRPLQDTGDLYGTIQEFKVIKLDRRRNNVVVSRREVLEEQNSSVREALLESLHEGQIIKGVVKNLTTYGAFVDLGGIDGLLHITDMSWKRVNDPSDVVTVGQEIDVRVLRYERERSRISLGLKQLQADPWEDISERYPAGTRLPAKVTNVTDYGCFAEIENGVEGLVHVSEMSWTQRSPNPAQLVQSGQDVEVMVLEVNPDNRRISLGMKQCMQNPWEVFEKKQKVGDEVSGKIRSITDFGIFVELAEGMNGLVHRDDISWEQSGSEAVKNYSRDQDIKAVVIGIDVKRERISLSIRELGGNPMRDYLDANPKGTAVKGSVLRTGNRLTLRLAQYVEGSVDSSQIVIEPGQEMSEAFPVGSEVEAMVLGTDRNNRRIQLSMRALLGDAEREQALKSVEGDGQAASTVGELIQREIDSKSGEAKD